MSGVKNEPLGSNLEARGQMPFFALKTKLFFALLQNYEAQKLATSVAKCINSTGGAFLVAAVHKSALRCIF